MDASDVSAIIIGTLNSSSHIVIICFVGALLNRKGFYPEAVQNVKQKISFQINAKS